MDLSEHMSQCPPRNVAVLGCSLPLRRVSERPIRLFPAGSPFQGTKLVARVTPEASLERLSRSLSRFSGSMETSVKYNSVGPADSRKGVQNSVQPAQVQQGLIHSGEP